MRKLYCFSYVAFERYMYQQGWTNQLPENAAVISITSSDPAFEGYDHLYTETGTASEAVPVAMTFDSAVKTGTWRSVRGVMNTSVIFR